MEFAPPGVQSSRQGRLPSIFQGVSMPPIIGCALKFRLEHSRPMYVCTDDCATTGGTATWAVPDALAPGWSITRRSSERYMPRHADWGERGTNTDLTLLKTVCLGELCVNNDQTMDTRAWPITSCWAPNMTAHEGRWPIRRTHREIEPWKTSVRKERSPPKPVLTCPRGVHWVDRDGILVGLTVSNWVVLVLRDVSQKIVEVGLHLDADEWRRAREAGPSVTELEGDAKCTLRTPLRRRKRS